MPNTPPTRSDVADLATAVRDLTKQVNDRDRHFKWAIGIGVFALIVALGLAWNAREQGLEAKAEAAEQDELAAVQELDRCRGTNAARQAARDGFDVFAETLIAATTPRDPEPGQVERFETTVRLFREGLAEGLVGLEPSDCTGDNTVTEVDFPPR